MHRKALFAAAGITAVLTSGAGALHGARINPSAVTHSGALTVASAPVNATTMTSDGIGWD